MTNVTQKNDLFSKNDEYQHWLLEIKNKIRAVQVRVALAASRELLLFYWDLGKTIADKQSTSRWGDKVIASLSADLRKDFPGIQGLSISNLKYCKRFYQFWSIGQRSVDQLENTEVPSIGQQGIDQIPWGHNIEIFTRCESVDEALFYISETVENGWGREILALQIKSNLFNRQGKAVNNFKATLPSPQSDLARQITKDPYTFDFMAMTAPYNELDIEKKLVDHIAKCRVPPLIRT